MIGLANGGSNLLRDIVGLGADLFIENCRLNGAADFVETLGMSLFVIQNFDDVKAVLGLHQIRDRSLGQGKRSLLKFGHGLAFNDPAQIATFGFGAIILGEFLGEIFKICAALCLLQNVFGLLADFRDFSVRLAHSLEQDVLDVHAILDFIFVDVGIVVGAQRIVTDGGGGAQFRKVQQGETRRTPLRNLI